MEKIVIFALVILSCVTLSTGNGSPVSNGSSEVMSKSTETTMVSASATPAATTTTDVKPTPTSGAVSFTASAGLVVSLVMALLH